MSKSSTRRVFTPSHIGHHIGFVLAVTCLSTVLICFHLSWRDKKDRQTRQGTGPYPHTVISPMAAAAARVRTQRLPPEVNRCDHVTV